jgi:hypothetical protein
MDIISTRGDAEHRGVYCDRWMNLCMADDGVRLELVPGDEHETEKLLKAGLIARRGKWAWMTEKGILAREIISA